MYIFLKYYIGIFLLSQFLGYTAGYGGSITSHTMEENIIYLTFASQTGHGDRTISCNRSDIFVGSLSDYFGGCIAQIYDNRYKLKITLDPWTTNITKGYVIQFHLQYL